MTEDSRWIIKQMFYLRPVPEGSSRSSGYGVEGPWPWHITQNGLWLPGQEDGVGHHPGTDFDVPEGTVVNAMADGYIAKAGWEFPQDRGRGYGLRIWQTISLSRWCLTYGHLSHIFVKPGAHIRRGDRIGRVGRTGQASRPHLHCHLEDPNGQFHEISFEEDSE